MQLLVLFCLVAGSLAQIDFNFRDCPANSHFASCGTACPLTCENYQNPPKVCVLMCKIGCECDEGYVLAKDGSCVLPESCPAQVVEKSCSDEPEPGLCRAYVPSWYYDNQSGTCKGFVYGGCGGNGNRYATEDECLQKCAGTRACPANSQYTSCGTACPLTCENYQNPPKVCVLMCKSGCECEVGYVLAKDGSCVLPENCPAQAAEKTCTGEAEPGLCRAYVPSWYYDSQSGTCKGFVYGGCGGNGNRYATEDECLQKCSGSSLDACDLPEETGVCKALFRRFAFDRTTGQCKQFVYGGCGGNANNFKTVEECERACPVQRALDRPDCDKKGEPGNCLAYIPRYYYDQEEGMCKKFIYGGCGGNRNNFATEFECLNKCGALAAPKLELCEQESETGFCRGYFPRYYYNKQTGECEQFIYGGCGGNDNNFSSKDNCEQVCKA